MSELGKKIDRNVTLEKAIKMIRDLEWLEKKLGYKMDMLFDYICYKIKERKAFYTLMYIRVEKDMMMDNVRIDFDKNSLSKGIGQFVQAYKKITPKRTVEECIELVEKIHKNDLELFYDVSDFIVRLEKELRNQLTKQKIGTTLALENLGRDKHQKESLRRFQII